jgi:bifunctional DNA-binding transcriptional regulator/antitoxin component of YhaV-PrlF toxin-antitoxin module
MVPAPVRDRLGAKPGDTLVFEEGCERSVMLASLRGTYFVVRVERAEEAKIDVESAVTVESGVVEDDSLPESFIESVKRKLEGK